MSEQVADFSGLAPYAREAAEPHRRGFWLTSLIVGASIFVWLSLVGGVVAGGSVAFELIHQSGRSSQPAHISPGSD
jgi:hypothetical protein